MKVLLSLMIMLLVVACEESSNVSTEVLEKKDSVEQVDTTEVDSTELDSTDDSSSIGDGAISGEAKEAGTVVGDSIIGWNEVVDSITLADGQKFGLTWVENFDSSAIDRSKWGFGGWTFPENDCQFDRSQVQLNDTTVSLVIAKDTTGESADRDYLGGEMFTYERYQFGRYVCRMKPSNPSGVISSFFLIDMSEDGHDWYEIDIEFVGKLTTNKVQFNLRSRLPEENGGIKDEAVIVDLPFDASEDFHVYTIDWTETYISFYIDGVLMYTYDDVDFVGRQAHEQSVRFNYWPTRIPEWSGELDTTSLPIETEYDYIAVYAGIVVEDE